MTLQDLEHLAQEYQVIATDPRLSASLTVSRTMNSNLYHQENPSADQVAPTPSPKPV